MRIIARSGLVLAVALAAATMLHATTISFYGMTTGTQITTQFASEGVTFQTAGGPVEPGGTGPAAIGWYGCTPGSGGGDGDPCGYGLANTPTGEYPTSEYLDIFFPNGASDVSFTFDNQGSSEAGERGGSYYDAYSGTTLVGTGALYSDPYADYYGTVTVAGSDITEIQLSNGSGGGSSWEFGVGEVTFSTPEPGTLTLLGGGLLGLWGLVRRKRNK